MLGGGGGDTRDGRGQLSWGGRGKQLCPWLSPSQPGAGAGGSPQRDAWPPLPGGALRRSLGTAFPWGETRGSLQGSGTPGPLSPSATGPWAPYAGFLWAAPQPETEKRCSRDLPPAPGSPGLLPDSLLPRTCPSPSGEHKDGGSLSHRYWEVDWAAGRAPESPRAEQGDFALVSRLWDPGRGVN